MMKNHVMTMVSLLTLIGAEPACAVGINPCVPGVNSQWGILQGSDIRYYGDFFKNPDGTLFFEFHDGNLERYVVDAACFDAYPDKPAILNASQSLSAKSRPY